MLFVQWLCLALRMGKEMEMSKAEMLLSRSSLLERWWPQPARGKAWTLCCRDTGKSNEHAVVSCSLRFVINKTSPLSPSQPHLSPLVCVLLSCKDRRGSYSSPGFSAFSSGELFFLILLDLKYQCFKQASPDLRPPAHHPSLFAHCLLSHHIITVYFPSTLLAEGSYLLYLPSTWQGLR